MTSAAATKTVSHQRKCFLWIELSLDGHFLLKTRKGSIVSSFFFSCECKHQRWWMSKKEQRKEGTFLGKKDTLRLPLRWQTWWVKRTRVISLSKERAGEEREEEREEEKRTRNFHSFTGSRRLEETGTARQPHNDNESEWHEMRREERQSSRGREMMVKGQQREDEGRGR